MFDQKQIAEFKEAFNMIDQNRDGFIDKQDLKEILSDLSACSRAPASTSSRTTALICRSPIL